MSVRVSITQGPLGAWQPEAAPEPGSSGAMLLFEGIVRATEDNRPLAALDYEAYRPMADETIERLALDIIARHALASMLVEHSIGRVPVGERSFRTVISSPHRREALAAMSEFIDRLKADVPIWKTPVWSPA
jgi:molybdopterin synthase catalytic subunit